MKRRRTGGAWWVAGAMVLAVRGMVAASGATPGPPTPVPDWHAPAAVAATETPLTEPILLADSSGAVHLFFADVPEGAERRTSALRYARWVDGRWSDPVTVAPGRDGMVLGLPALALDDHGWLHAVYSGPQWGRVEYRRIPLAEIGDAKAWSPAQVLSDTGGLHVAVATGADEMVYALYASHSHHVSFHRSDDGGRTWSQPLRLSELDPALVACDNPRLAVDGRGRLHAVWTQFSVPRGWPAVGSFYRRSDDGGRTWLPVRQVSGDGSGQINLVTRGTDEVHLAWTDLELGDRIHTWSRDGGATWSAPRAIGAGLRGAPTRALGLAFDSGGALHLVTSVGGLGGVQPIVHSTWDGTTWSAPEPVSAGMAEAQPVGLPSVAISAGNHLHVAYKGDDANIWYSDRMIDAPLIAPRPLPTRGTDWRTRLRDTSLQLRALVALLALLAGEAGLSWLRRQMRGGRPAHAAPVPRDEDRRRE